MPSRHWGLLIALATFLLSCSSGCAHSSGSYRICEDKSWAPDKVVAYVVDSAIANNSPPADFVPVEKQPVILSKSDPSYPEDMLSSVHEKYRIWVLVWVGRTGLVRQLRIRLCEPQQLLPYIVEAAKQMKFAPAEVKGDSVDVWVSIPFQYPK
jgi:hypothetical protein